MCKTEFWIQEYKFRITEIQVKEEETKKHTDTHINTMTRSGLWAGPSENRLG